MAVPLLLPKLNFTMNEGTLTQWLVPDGAAVTQGQLIYSVEAEKAVMDVESPATGILRVIAQPGEILTVGALLGEVA